MAPFPPLPTPGKGLHGKIVCAKRGGAGRGANPPLSDDGRWRSAITGGSSPPPPSSPLGGFSLVCRSIRPRGSEGGGVGMAVRERGGIAWGGGGSSGEGAFRQQDRPIVVRKKEGFCCVFFLCVVLGMVLLRVVFWGVDGKWRGSLVLK